MSQPPDIWFPYFMGLLMLALTGLQLWSGKTMLKGGAVFSRDKSPGLYWFNVALTFGIGTFAIARIARELVTVPDYLPALTVWVLASGGLVAMAWKPLLHGTFGARPVAVRIAFSPRSQPQSATSITVRGWSQPELEKILTDFLKLYELPNSEPLTVNVVSEDTFVVPFAEGVDAETIYVLVNYLHYPKGFALEGRSIAVVGRMILAGEFRRTHPDLIGQQALIYVPTDDTDYDLIYVTLASGEVYKVNFTDLAWQRVSDPRMSPVDRALL